MPADYGAIIRDYFERNTNHPVTEKKVDDDTRKITALLEDKYGIRERKLTVELIKGRVIRCNVYLAEKMQENETEILKQINQLNSNYYYVRTFYESCSKDILMQYECILAKFCGEEEIKNTIKDIFDCFVDIFRKELKIIEDFKGSRLKDGKEDAELLKPINLNPFNEMRCGI